MTTVAVKMSGSPTTPTAGACDCDGDEMADSSPRRRKGYIPYVTIYESQDEVRKSGYWIPGIPIDAKIVKVEKDTSTHYHILNPFLYTIRLQHGRYQWQVIKRYQDFSYLRNRLIAHRAVERIKTPMKRAKHRLEEVIEGDDDDGAESGAGKVSSVVSKKFNKSRSGLRGLEITEVHILWKDVELVDYFDGCHNSYAHEDGDSVADDQREASDLSLPHFPMIPDSMISESHINERREKLEAWLQSVLNIPINRDYHETAEFLEVSRFSFINELGGKYREGNIKKRPGGNKVYIGFKQCCMRWFLPWGKRWLMVKDTYVCYMDPWNEHIRLVLLFDEQFEINSPVLTTDIRPKELVLSNLQHVLNMKCSRAEETIYWIRDIKSVLKDTGEVWLRKKPFGSSFPPREKIYCQWFVDAKEYWEKASAMIELAREEIFIADWWLCPEVYMRRPMAEGNHWRLDHVLKRAAEKGVHIFILIYKEMEMALMLNSLLTKKYLNDLHPNIKVMRHPDHYFGTGTFFWAHHEKLLIVDQLIAFVGGLDLCYGRWDTSGHALTDLGSIQIASVTAPDLKLDEVGIEGADDLVEVLVKDRLPGTDANMNRLQQIGEEIQKEEGEDLGERHAPTFPRHDETTHGIDKSRSTKKNLRDAMHRVMDRVKHSSRDQTPDESTGGGGSLKTPATAQRRKSADATTPADMSRAALTFRHAAALFGGAHASGGYVDETTTGGAGDSTAGNPPAAASLGRTPFSDPRNRTMMRRVVSGLKMSKNKRRWRMPIEQEDPTGDEYVANYCKLQANKVDMTGLQGAGKLWPGKDYVNYIIKDFVDLANTYDDFINRYNTPRTPWHDIHSVVYGEAARDLARHFIQRWNATKTEKLKNNDKYPYLLPKLYNSVRVPRVFINDDTHCADVQVLRSVAHWSTLIDRLEDSVQQAYVSLIANAQHFVYIENQFFVSMIGSSDVANEVCAVLCDRIVRAHQNGETFRVYVIIPLLPGFEGDIGNQYSSLLAVLNWTMLSVSKGPYSLLVNLRERGVDDPWKYLSFCSLRTYDELCGKLVTEMVYVHCKLLIVDDVYTIIGSANINDRSQVGNRDSEVCVLVKDRRFMKSRMNGKEYEAGCFAGTLRQRLMREHLGMLSESRLKTPHNIDVTDPIADAFYKDVWCRAASDNTRIYEEVFRCYPTNYVETFDELTAWRAQPSLANDSPDEARRRLTGVVGQIVNFPVDFLKREDLSPTIISKEGLVPSAVFT